MGENEVTIISRIPLKEAQQKENIKKASEIKKDTDVEELKKMVNNIALALIANGIDVEELI